jgi:sugar phosphate isomerase/epimerase
MDIAFTNLACPGWSIERVADAALGMGYDAVELRLLDGDLIDPVRDRGKMIRAVGHCRERGLPVCALGTSCRFNVAGRAERASEEDTLVRWIDLASITEVPLLRVYGGPGDPATPEDTANAWVAESLRRIAPAATDAFVTIVIETHDAFASARRVAAVLEAIDSPAVAALWDSHHTYRVGESVEEVIGLLGTRIAHVHVKDARRRADGEGWDLVPLGEGEVPVASMLEALRAAGYEGVVSVEWEKKWHPDLAEPEVALPQHLDWLRRHLPQQD